MNKQKIRQSFNANSEEMGKLYAYAHLFQRFKDEELKGEELVEVGIKRKENKPNTELFNSIEFSQYLIEHLEDLENIMNCNKWDEFLYWFLKKPKFQTLPVFKALMLTDSEKFIQALRFSGVLVRDKVYEILDELEFPPNIQLHKDFQKGFIAEDKKLWKEIQNYHKQWKSYEIAVFLGNLVNWLEVKRVYDDSDYNLELLVKAYNFIISYYLSAYSKKGNGITEESIYKGITGSIKLPNEELYFSFNTILNYTKFRDGVILQYMYDSNAQPIYRNGKWDFIYKDEELRSNWDLDGQRYALNNFRYQAEASKASSSNPKTKLDLRFHKIHLLLQDSKLARIKYKSTEYDVLDLFAPIVTYSELCKAKYEEKLNFLKGIKTENKEEEDFNTWYSVYKSYAQICSSEGTLIFPSVVIDSKDFIVSFKNLKSIVNEKQVEDALELLSYNIGDNYTFNRFQIGYDVWFFPFVKIGDLNFCPTMFFAKNDWFYSVAQAVLKNYHHKANRAIRKDSSNEFEVNLKEELRRNCLDWDVSYPVRKHDGDIDIIVSDGENDLLIQLKRTYFRLSLKDAFFETMNSDRKAMKQLLQGEDYFLNNPKEYKLSDKRYKWIVSTSFEGVNEVVEGCRKVNYYDLLWALRNFEFKSLDSLVEYFENDRILEYSEHYIHSVL